MNEEDSDAYLSLSQDSPYNATEVVETESSHAMEDNLSDLKNKYDKYEINSFSLDSDQRLKRGTIHSIELHNFKSYFGTVFIEKLSSFNAIIGPNGSGKSNLMDAISFVLCIRTSTLRGSNLKDLINKNPDPSDPVETRGAYVALTLKGDTDYSVFKRAINNKGNITYIYNNNVITFKGYTEALHEYKINTLGSTGLIFQGSVNDIIRRSPSELTKLFETISGSTLYEKPYNFVKEKLELVRSDYKNVLAKKKQLMNELKQFRTMEANNRKHQQNLEDYNQTQLNVYAWELEILGSKFRDYSSKYRKLRKEYEELTREFESSNRSKNQLEEKMANLYYEQGKLNRVIQQKKQTLNNIRTGMTEYFGKKVSMENEIENMERTNQTNKENLENLESQKEELKRMKKEEEWEESKMEKELSSVKGTGANLTEGQMREFKEYLKEFENKTSTIKVNVNILKTSMNQYKTENKMVSNQLKSIEKQTEETRQNLEKQNGLVENMEKRLREYKDALETLHLSVSQLENNKSELKEKKEELELKKKEYEERISGLTAMKQEYMQNFKRSIVNNDMKKEIKGVYGEVVSLFEVNNKSYNKSIMTSLGNRSKLIVAKDYETISKCIKYLKDNKLERREFIPLDRINTDKSKTRRLIGNYIKKNARVNYVFVIDSMEFEERYRNLFEYLVGDAVIVSDLEEAEKIIKLQDNSRLEGQKVAFNIVTEEGQLITKNKTIVIGSKIISKSNEMELEIAKYNKYINLVNEGEKELQVMEKREKNMCEEIEKNKNKLEKYTRNIQLTNVKLEFMRKQKQLSKMNEEELESEVRRIEKRKKELDKSVSKLEEELKKENVKLEKIKKEHFMKLNEKYGVEDVYELVSKRDDKVEGLKQRIADKRSVILKYNSELEEVETKMEAIKTKNMELAEKTDSLKRELEKLKKTNVNVCENIESLQSEIEDKGKMLESYTNQIESCKLELKKIGKGEEEKYGKDDRIKIMEEMESLKENIKNAYKEGLSLAETCKVKNIQLGIKMPEEKGKQKRLQRVRDEVEELSSPDEVYLDSEWEPRRYNNNNNNNNYNSNSSHNYNNDNNYDNNNNGNNYNYNINNNETDDDGERDEVEEDFESWEFPELVNREDFNFSKKREVLEDQCEHMKERMKSLNKTLVTSRSYKDAELKAEATAEELEKTEREGERLKAQLLKLESDFENIKRERSGLFLHCFQKVKENIGPIYRKLSSREGEAEGQAFLSLDDVVSNLEVEPFNCNIRYNTMPPMKKYLDLNLQSGGEKALSSIALLLALHNYRESPFVVLDEVDANIDSLKLRNLTKYLMESSFQVIIISLKEKLFSKAQRLIGVYRNHPNWASRCVVLNLEEYEAESDEEGPT